MDLYAQLASSAKDDEAKRVAMPPRPVQAGIGAALRDCYGVVQLSEEFSRLLARLR